MDCYVNNGDFLFPSNEFEYEVDLEVFQENLYYIAESRTFTCKEYIEGIITPSVYSYKNFRLERSIKLVGAPLEWIKSKGLELYVEKPKEKRTPSVKKPVTNPRVKKEKTDPEAMDKFLRSIGVRK